MPPRPRILPPPPRVIPPAGVTTAPANYPGSGTQAGPKKETARISILPQPAARPTPAPTVKMTKTQPLVSVPPTVQTAPAILTPADPAPASATDASVLDQVPLPVCWMIFGISTVILLIQIWNYFGS
jgi:hypothetical protein